MNENWSAIRANAPEEIGKRDDSGRQCCTPKQAATSEQTYETQASTAMIALWLSDSFPAG